MESTFSRLQSHNEETVYFLPLSPQELLVLSLSSSELWKAESTKKNLWVAKLLIQITKFAWWYFTWNLHIIFCIRSFWRKQNYGAFETNIGEKSAFHALFYWMNKWGVMLKYFLRSVSVICLQCMLQIEIQVLQRSYWKVGVDSRKFVNVVPALNRSGHFLWGCSEPSHTGC